MKKTKIMLAVLSLVSVAAYATQNMNTGNAKDNYNSWKSRPDETFSDAENNFGAVKKMLLERYVDAKITDEALMQAATKGMLDSLNPNDKEDWNKLYSPGEFKEFQVDVSGDVVGIGVAIKFNEDAGSFTIIGVIPGSVAEKGGIKSGDQLVSVDGKVSQGLQFRDVVYSIRGKAGETIKLKLLRGDEVITKKITREKLNWAPVELEPLKNEVALIRIEYFNEKSPAQFKTALEKVKSEHAKGLIIDLRKDEGGLFDEAVQSTGFLTPKGKTIVNVESRGGAQKNYPAEGDAILQNIPVVILVSEKTSSGAELFAGSLSENIGAKIVGQRTHGKWSAQTLEKLTNGYAVKFTTSLFKTPSGKSYQGTGLNPDISATVPEEQLNTAYELLGKGV